MSIGEPEECGQPTPNPYQSSAQVARDPSRMTTTPFPTLSIGLLTGTCVGVSHASACVLAWWLHDCPNFLIRPGNATTFAMAMALGLIFGCIYGIAVREICERLQLIVRKGLHFWITNGVSFAISLLAAEYLLRTRNNASLVLVSIPLTFAVAFISAVVTSRKYSLPISR